MVVAVQVAAIDDDVGRFGLDRRVPPGPELDEVGQLRDAFLDTDVEADQPVAPRAGFSAYRRF